MTTLDDELLSLVEGPRKRKRKCELVDGLYTSEQDKEVLRQMNELEREMILAERAEKMQKILDRRALSMIVRDGAASVPSYNIPECAPTPEPFQDGYGLPFSAPTPRSAPTPEPVADAHSDHEVPFSAPMPSTPEQCREPESLFSAPTPEPFREPESLFSAPTPEPFRPTPLFARSPTPETYLEASLFDLERCRLSRRLVVRFLKMSWFEKYIQGMWVRYPIGSGKYRIMRVKALSKEAAEPYQIDGTTYTRKVELVCGGVTRNVTLELISNGAFTEEEFTLYKGLMSRDAVPFPTMQDVQIKTQVMAQLASILQHIKHPATKTFWRYEEWQKRVHSTKLAQLERAQEQNQHAEVLKLHELLTEFEHKYGVDKFTSLSGRNKPMQIPKKMKNRPGTPKVRSPTTVVSMVSLEVDLGDF